MHYFRSRWMKWLVTGCISLTAIAIIISHQYFGELAASFTAAVCCATSALAIALAIAWLKQVERLTDYVDDVLHGGAALDISGNHEGELSIFKNELLKLASALQHQLELQTQSNARQAANLADISHQLKTPLTSMHLVVRQLSEHELRAGGFADDSGQGRLLREAEQLLKRMDWLTQGLLQVSRIESGTVNFARNKVDVAELLDRALEPLLIPLELRNMAIVRAGESGASFIGDQNWTMEALSNVIKNCMEHTLPGGSIYISYLETHIFTRIVIRDTGEGIPDDELPYIFNRYYIGSNSSMNSMGIGLSLASEIVRRQNGTISARSGKEGGAVFTIEFMKRVV